MPIPVLAGIVVFSRNIPLPLKKVGNLMSKQPIKGTIGNNAIRQQKCDIPLNSQLCLQYLLFILIFVAGNLTVLINNI
jgi:hypothetical protein